MLVVGNCSVVATLVVIVVAIVVGSVLVVNRTKEVVSDIVRGEVTAGPKV